MIYHPLYGMKNYSLIWGDWLSCDPLTGSHDSQSPHIRKHLCPILWRLWFNCHKLFILYKEWYVTFTVRSYCSLALHSRARILVLVTIYDIVDFGLVKIAWDIFNHLRLWITIRTPLWHSSFKETKCLFLAPAGKPFQRGDSIWTSNNIIIMVSSYSTQTMLCALHTYYPWSLDLFIGVSFQPFFCSIQYCGHFGAMN